MYDAQSRRTMPESATLATALVGPLRDAVVNLGAAIDTMMARRRARLQLQSLDDRMLKDIGVSRADVAAESCKPFWRE